MRNDMSLGKYIADRRKRMHLTQEELGGRIGVSKSAVAKWETNRGIPDRDNLKRLSDVLDISMDEIHMIIDNVVPNVIDLNINITPEIIALLESKGYRVIRPGCDVDSK